MTAEELAAGRERMLRYSRREEFGLTPNELRILLAVMAYDRAYGLDVPRKALTAFVGVTSPTSQINALVGFGALRVYNENLRAYIQATLLAWERLGLGDLAPEYLRYEAPSAQSAA